MRYSRHNLGFSGRTHEIPERGDISNSCYALKNTLSFQLNLFTNSEVPVYGFCSTNEVTANDDHFEQITPVHNNQNIIYIHLLLQLNVPTW